MASVSIAQIDAAADSLALQRMGVKLQAEAVDNAKAAADAAYQLQVQAVAASTQQSVLNRAVWERQAAAGEKMVAEFEKQAAILDQGGTRRELVAMLFKELVAGYMKPGTATTLDTQAADARADAQYLGVAMDEALKVYDAQLAKVPAQQ